MIECISFILAIALVIGLWWLAVYLMRTSDDDY